MQRAEHKFLPRLLAFVCGIETRFIPHKKYLTRIEYRRKNGGKPTEKEMNMEKARSRTLYVEDELFERLDRLADGLGMTRNRLIRNLLTVGADELETLQKVGGFKMVVYVNDLRTNIGRKLKAVSV